MTLLVLTPAQAAVVASALFEAEQYRRDTARKWCTACATAPNGACLAHLGFVGPADAYRQLRDSLALPASAEKAGRGARNTAAGA